MDFDDDLGPWALLGGVALLGTLALAAVGGRRGGGGLNLVGEEEHGLRLEPRPGHGLYDLVTSARTIPIERFAKGGFAVAYREIVPPHRVFVVVPEYVRDKDAAADAYVAAGATNPHLPAVRRFGRMKDGRRVYVMPYYEVPSPVLLGHNYKALYWCEASGEADKGLDPGDVEGQQAAFLACAERRGVAPSVVDGLAELAAAGAKYSDEFRFDTTPDNFAIDAEGRMVLLDVIWDAKASRRLVAR